MKTNSFFKSFKENQEPTTNEHKDFQNSSAIIKQPDAAKTEIFLVPIRLIQSNSETQSISAHDT